MSSAPDTRVLDGQKRVSRVIRGTLFLAMSTAISVVGPIATVPVALHGWGPSKYGEWLTLAGLVTFLGMSDLGLQSYVVNRMAVSFARNDADAIVKDLHSALRVQVPVVACLWSVGALLLGVAPIDRWLSVSSAGRVDICGALVLLGAELLIGVPMGVIAGIYRATGKLPRAAVITVFQRAALIALPIAMIALRQSFTIVALTRCLVACALALYVMRDLRRLYPWFSVSPLRGSFSEGRAMLGPAALFFVAALSDFIIAQGNTLIVQTAIGGSAVSLLATHRTIANFGRIVPNMLSSAVWPEMTMVHALDDRVLLKRLLRTISKLQVWIVGIVFLGFLPLAKGVYEAWTFRELHYDGLLLALIVGQTVMWAMSNAASTLLVATNHQGRLLAVMLPAAALNLTISFVAVPRLGVRGAALGGFCGELLFSAWLTPYIACRVIGDAYADVLRRMATSCAAAVLLPASIAAGLWWSLPDSYTRVVVVSFVGCACSCSFTWLTLDEYERVRLLEGVRRLRRRAANAMRARPAEP